MDHGMRCSWKSSFSVARTGNWRGVLAIAATLVMSWATLSANDAYYQTLMPPMFPPSPAPTNQPGLCNQLAGLYSGRVGRVRKMVLMSDEPRQAAMSALQYPCLGVTLAGNALSAGLDAEREKMVTCVDLYFEAVAFSWNFLQSPDATRRPEYRAAWELYHHGLARLIGSAQQFGRLDPTSGLRVMTPTGMQTIPTSYHGFVWKPGDFTRVDVFHSEAPKKLTNHYSCPGLGVPLVVVREQREPDRFLSEQTPFGATAILRPSLAALAGQAPPLGAKSSHGPLEFHDPLRVTAVEFGGQRIAMATNTSAALEYAVRESGFSPWEGLVRPGSAEAGQEKLFLLEPYQAGKYPVVFVHGFFSSPRIWAQFANEIQARPDLRNCVQLMAYRYPTGRPFTESAAILRRELLAMKATFDPRGEDPGIANMALVGHSMGGLVSKLAVTHSDDRLWCSVANRPLAEIKASDRLRKQLQESFYFQPIPFVRRVVFMGTPHDGSQLVSRVVGGLGSTCVQLPSAERIEHAWLVKQNPGVFSREFAKSIPTSIDLMEPSSGLLQAVKTLCPGENVQLHNIIGVGCLSPLEGCGDGVVARESAQHPWVTTERQVLTTHGGLHESEESVEELICILRRHIAEANDVPSVDGYEFAVPEFECPDSILPEIEQPCPAEGQNDPCLDDFLFDPCEMAPPCPEQSVLAPHSVLAPDEAASPHPALPPSAPSGPLPSPVESVIESGKAGKPVVLDAVETGPELGFPTRN